MGRASKRERGGASDTSPPAPRFAVDAPHRARLPNTLLALLVVGVATALVYSNTFDASFHFDDIPNIVQRPSLRDLGSFWPPSGYRYLGYLSFALNFRAGGLDVFGYHLANLVIHLCNGLLVFWLAALTLRTPVVRRASIGPLVGRYLPLTAALLFAVHPVQTQAVTYIVQRFASLATFFYLLSISLYVAARLSLEAEGPSKARATWLYCLSVAAAAGAMETKEISITLPFVAAGYELLFFRDRRRLRLLVPLATTALLVPLGLLAHGEKLANALVETSRLTTETQDISRSVYFLTQTRVVATYLRLLLAPVGQNLEYDFRLSDSWADPAVLLSLAVLLGVAASAAFFLIRARRTNRAEGRLFFFGVAWFFVTLSVESSIVPIRDVIFEHRVYLPSAGAALALGTGLLWALERVRVSVPERLRISVGSRALVGAALLLTVGPLGAAAYARNLVWKDELTLWSDVVAKSPSKARPRSNLGAAYWRNGQVGDAIREYREAIRLDPGYGDAHTNLGVVFAATGRTEEAVRELVTAIGLNPEDAEAHYNLGLARWASGHVEDAIREYGEAIRFNPGLAEAHSNLGAAYDAKNQLDDAIREYREAIRLDPGLGLAHYNLALAYEAKGQLDDAIREYRETIRLDPKDAEARRRLGGLLGKQGRASGAAKE